jgi:hypothetical protein
MNTNKIGHTIHKGFYKGLGIRSHPRFRILSRLIVDTTVRRQLSSHSDHQKLQPGRRPILGQLHTPELLNRARMSGRVPIESQRVDAPLTSSATFLVLSITESSDAIRTVRSALAGIGGLAKNVAIRDLSASFACTVGVGSDVWDRVTGLPRPSELHPFPAVKGAVRKFIDIFYS